MEYTPYKLDKVRNIRLGMRAISRVEKTLGKPIMEIMSSECTMQQMATVLWAGMVHEDPELMPEKVMDLIDEYSSIKEADKVLGEALANAFREDDDSKNAQAAENPSL